MKKIIPILLIIILLCGCGKKSDIISGKEAKVQVINNSAILIDVREKEEFDEEHISGALSLPLSSIEDITTLVPDKKKILVVYCASGNRSKKAKIELISMGYETVYDMGSMINWYE